MDQIYTVLSTLQGFYIFEVLIILSALLILIDYLFYTDVPAHIGYFCLSAAVFFGLNKSFFFPDTRYLIISLVIALVVWLVLAILHRVLFRSFLENAPGTEGYAADNQDAE